MAVLTTEHESVREQARAAEHVAADRPKPQRSRGKLGASLSAPLTVHDRDHVDLRMTASKSASINFAQKLGFLIFNQCASERSHTRSRAACSQCLRSPCGSFAEHRFALSLDCFAQHNAALDLLSHFALRSSGKPRQALSAVL